MNSTISIGDVTKASGIPASAIRYYEAIGLIPPPTRVNGRRRYDAQIMQRLQIIQFCQQAGFTLAEIHALFFGFASGTHPSIRWEAFAQRKLADVEAQIARLQAMQAILRQGMECGCMTMDDCALWLSGNDAGNTSHTGAQALP
jgi:MerR family redox-sensitive transcriptional activator SoxR